MISLSEHGGNGGIFLMILSSGTFKRKMGKRDRKRYTDIHHSHMLTHVHMLCMYTHVLVHACTSVLVYDCTCIFVCCVHCFVLSSCGCDCVVLNKAKNVYLEEFYLLLLHLYLEK